MSKVARKRMISELGVTDQNNSKRRNSKSPRQSSKRSSSANKPGVTDDIEIFDILSSKSFKMEKLIDQIDKKIQQAPGKAFEDLVVLIFKALGYGEATLNLDISNNFDLDIEAILKHIYEMNIVKTLNYFPLFGKGKEFRQFKNNYLTFWTELTKFSEQFIFSSTVINESINLLVALSRQLQVEKSNLRSKLRTIRFGAAETLVSIARALVNLLTKMNDEYTKQKEMLKLDKKLTKKQIEELEKGNEHIKLQIKKIEKLIGNINKDFIKKRYNDSMPEIRAKVIELLSFGMTKARSLFPGESLTDILRALLKTETEVNVLIACIDLAEELVKPLDDPDRLIEKNIKSLKKEFFDLCFNSNSKVAARAFSFIKTSISRLDLTQIELNELYHLIFYENELVSEIAVDFVTVMVFDSDLLNAGYESKEFAFQDHQDDSKSQIIKFIKLFGQINSQTNITQERVEKFVDAFYDKTHVFFDYATIFSLILDEKFKKATGTITITDRDREILLHFIYATIKLSRNFVTMHNNYEKGFKEFADMILSHANECVKLRATELLTSTKLNNALLHGVLQIFEEADMASFFTSDNQTKYKAFLSILRDIFEINDQPTIISGVAKLYSTYCRNPEVGEKVKETVDQISINVVANFMDFFKKYEDNSNDQEIINCLTRTLMKIAKLSIYFVVPRAMYENFTQKIYKLILNYISSKSESLQDIAHHSVYLIFYIQLWKLKKILLNEDYSEDDALAYIEFREKALEHFIKFLEIKEIPNQPKHHVIKLQETAFSLLVETLCFVCSDRLAKIKGLYFRAPKPFLNSLLNYVHALEGLENHKLQNSASKQLVQDIKRSQQLQRSEESEEEAEERNQNPEAPNLEDGSRPAQKLSSDRYLYHASLLTKLLMSCTTLTYSDFSVQSTIWIFKNEAFAGENLIKALLNHLKNKEIEEENQFMNYWRFVDEVLLKLHQDEEVRKACEFAKIAAKTYFDKYEKQDEEKQREISERFLKYLINAIIYSNSSKKNYDFLSVIIALCSRNYLDNTNYRRLLAFFEVDMREKKKAIQEKPEENKEENQATESKEDYISRFRAHLCKITGLKYKKDETRRTMPVRETHRKNSSVTKAQTLKNKAEIADTDHEEESESENENPNKRSDSKGRIVKALSKGKLLKKESNTKKRKEREYSNKGVKGGDIKDAEKMILGIQGKKSLKTLKK